LHCKAGWLPQGASRTEPHSRACFMIVVVKISSNPSMGLSLDLKLGPRDSPAAQKPYIYRDRDRCCTWYSTWPGRYRDFISSLVFWSRATKPAYHSLEHSLLMTLGEKDSYLLTLVGRHCTCHISSQQLETSFVGGVAHLGLCDIRIRSAVGRIASVGPNPCSAGLERWHKHVPSLR
jgi:hypothetical protein